MDEPTPTDAALVPAQPQALAQVLPADPEEMIAKASSMATHLKAIIKQGNHYSMIRNKAHVHVEGWTTLGGMLGVFPRTEWTRRMEGDVIAYEARISLVHAASGREVCAVESMASAEERAPWGRQEYSIRSMAQTRATGKAYRQAFSWIMTMAGYSPTPDEEMPHDLPRTPHKQTPTPTPEPKARRPASCADCGQDVLPGTGGKRRKQAGRTVISCAECAANDGPPMPQWADVPPAVPSGLAAMVAALEGITVGNHLVAHARKHGASWAALSPADQLELEHAFRAACDRCGVSPEGVRKAGGAR